MSVIDRNNELYIYFRPFGEELIGLKTFAATKREAKEMETMLLRACRTGDYSSLDLPTRELGVRMFQNKKLEMPLGLLLQEELTVVLTVWDAVTLFLRHPEIKDSAVRERHEYCLSHLVKHWGKDFPVKDIWIPEIKQYQVDRLNEGAAPATVNREKSTLSKLFQILMEFRRVDVNPARLVKNLSEKSGERQVYISCKDFNLVLAHLPGWYRPVAQMAYYTGMRKGEIRNLSRTQVNLSRRIILIGPEDTKEGHWKRVPIHRNLVSVLEEALKLRSIGSDHVFLRDGAPLSKGNGRRPWEDAVETLGLNPAPHFHDLRHTWKTNARRSGMDPEIRESILGHWFKEKSVTERYGRISDHELRQAIDLMTLDHGDTEIFVTAPKKDNPRKRRPPRPRKNVNRVLTSGTGQSTGKQVTI
ncbi:MAG: tyrosine-type recombinase/integrase [Desulfomonilaceae bacterium]